MGENECNDALIVGAGFSGIYLLILLRRLGLRCMLVEAGSDFGGAWHWNRYPGARVDSPVPFYELMLPELWKDWTWTEKFPGQPELQAYFTYVGDKLDLRPHCRFDTVVKQALWDDEEHVWHIAAEGKDGLYEASARYFMPCVGIGSKPYLPGIKGRDTFKGPCCHTSRWPKEGIETAGKRIGVIGTGASGVQFIQEIGPHVEHLTVFQRTPNIALPMGQCSVSKQVQDHFKLMYDEMYHKLRKTHYGLPYEFIPRSLSDDSDEQREAIFEKLWDLAGFSFLSSNYQDTLMNRASNDTIYAFWRRQVSKRIEDPNKRALLAPAKSPHPFGAKRSSLEQRFYEVVSQENVDIVDTKATPILEICENGLRTADKEYGLDVLVFATGFDTYGGFNAIDLRGLNGETIQDHWKDGARTYLGMTIDNFPNLFFTHGPQGPTAFSNGPVSLQLQGEWVAQTIEYLREHNVTKFVPTRHAASTFKKRVDDLCAATLFPEVDSWYMRGNIPGEKREVHSYAGGLIAYQEEITAEVEHGYPGFLRSALEERCT